MIKQVAKELLKLAEGTRHDFHEPDEQGIKFIGVVGTHLDNAFGSQVKAESIVYNHQEVVVILCREDKTYKFNLADLLALAKAGARQETRYVEIPKEKRCQTT